MRQCASGILAAATGVTSRRSKPISTSEAGLPSPPAAYVMRARLLIYGEPQRQLLAVMPRRIQDVLDSARLDRTACHLPSTTICGCIPCPGAADRHNAAGAASQRDWRTGLSSRADPSNRRETTMPARRGGAASSATSASAGGHEEQASEVNSSTRVGRSSAAVGARKKRARTTFVMPSDYSGAPATRFNRA